MSPSKGKKLFIMSPQKNSLCLLIPHDYPVHCKCFVHTVYLLKTPAYLQIHSFNQNLTQELLPLKELPNYDLFSSSQSNILPYHLTPCIYSGLHYHTFLCSPAVYLELHFFHSVTVKYLKN